MLCSERVGETVQYGEIAKALDLGTDGDEGEEVETWVIDGKSFSRLLSITILVELWNSSVSVTS